MAALSDYRVAFDEAFRFEGLIASLRVADMNDDNDNVSEASFGGEEEGIWEARTAAMSLINAITNCPDSLEERIMLRDEFSRRGLNEVIVVRRRVMLYFRRTLTSYAGTPLRQTSRSTAYATRCVHGRKVRR